MSANPGSCFQRDGFTKLIPQSEIARVQNIGIGRATQHAHDVSCTRSFLYENVFIILLVDMIVGTSCSREDFKND